MPGDQSGIKIGDVSIKGGEFSSVVSEPDFACFLALRINSAMCALASGHSESMKL